jgi:hypothetical protein
MLGRDYRYDVMTYRARHQIRAIVEARQCKRQVHRQLPISPYRRRHARGSRDFRADVKCASTVDHVHVKVCIRMSSSHHQSNKMVQAINSFKLG